jgi:hypothetical protein
MAAAALAGVWILASGCHESPHAVPAPELPTVAVRSAEAAAGVHRATDEVVGTVRARVQATIEAKVVGRGRADGRRARGDGKGGRRPGGTRCRGNAGAGRAGARRAPAGRPRSRTHVGAVEERGRDAGGVRRGGIPAADRPGLPGRGRNVAGLRPRSGPFRRAGHPETRRGRATWPLRAGRCWSWRTTSPCVSRRTSRWRCSAGSGWGTGCRWSSSPGERRSKGWWGRSSRRPMRRRGRSG